MRLRSCLAMTLLVAAAGGCSTDTSGLGGPTSGDAGGGAGGGAGAGGRADGGGSGGQSGNGGKGGAAGQGGGGSGGAMDAGMPDTPAPSMVGCADGTREGFKMMATWPSIAACAGGWEVRGVVTPESRSPQCGRHAGNNAANESGSGCSVADLCAEGWHVCEDVDEVQRTSRSGCEGAVASGAAQFFATRQGAFGTMCTSMPGGQNNVHGCGNIGHAEDATCNPFPTRLQYDDCMMNPPWECGNDSDSMIEGARVRKPGAARGGVLCCRD